MVLAGLGTVRCVSDEGCLGTVEEGILTIMGNLQIVSVDPDLDDATEMLLAGLVVDKLPTTPRVTSTLASLDAEAVAGAIGTMAPTVYDPDSPVIFKVERGKVTKLADAEEDFEATEATLPDLGEGWSGAEYMRTTTEDDETTDADETVTEMVVSYTNAEDPTDQEYTVYYSTSAAVTRDGVQGADAAGELMLSMDQTGNHGLFSIAFGITAPHQTVPIEHDDPDTTDVEMESTFEGMFNGIPGKFSCTGVCTVESDDMGNLMTLTGEWTFEPTVAEDGELADIMVMGVVDDTDYLDFGFWIVTSQGDDGPMYMVGIFQDGMREHGAGVVGTAEYAGRAAGIYMTKAFDPATGDPIPLSAGQFTAHAMLTAYFGDTDMSVPSEDHNSVSGTISNFMNGDGEMIGEKWEVELMRAMIESGAFTGVTSTGEGSDPGAWDGQFYGPPNDGADTPVDVMPDSVAGTFNAHFNNGHAAGAFGATMVEEDE